MRRLGLLAGLLGCIACGKSEQVPSSGVLQALAQSATVSGLYAVVTDGSSIYSGEPQLIDPNGFTIDFTDMPGNTSSIFVVILGDIAGTMVPLIAWVPNSGLSGGDFVELNGAGRWEVPTALQAYDFDLDDDLANNFSEVLGNTDYTSSWTTVAAGLAVRDLSGNRASNMLVTTSNGLRYPGDLTVPRYQNNISTARVVDAPVPKNLTFNGDTGCAAAVDPRSVDFDQDRFFIGGTGGCFYTLPSDALIQGAPIIAARSLASVAQTWRGTAYFGNLYLAAIADSNGRLHFGNNLNTVLSGSSTSITMSPQATLTGDYFWVDLPAVPGAAGLEPILVATHDTLSIVKAQDDGGRCDLDGATYFEGTTNIERIITFSNAVTAGVHVYVVYQRPSAQRVVRRIRVSLTSGMFAACAGLVIQQDPVVVLPSQMGEVTAMALGTVDALASSASSGSRALFLGDDAGHIAVVENADSWNSSSSATLLTQLPGGEAVVSLAIPSDNNGGAEQLLRSLFVATPSTVYRLP